MSLNDLSQLPAAPVPMGYRVRPYRDGDVTTWVNLHLAAERHREISAALFREAFGYVDDPLVARMVFLEDAAGTAWGTATGWWDDLPDGNTLGRIHWVCMHPKKQGQGLAKPLLRAALKRLVTAGHGCCYLTTSAARLPAILLYRSFGFTPIIETHEDHKIWEAIHAQAAGVKRQ